VERRLDVNAAGPKHLDALLDYDLLLARGEAVLHKIRDRAAGCRACGGIFSVVELHAGVPVCAGVCVGRGDAVEELCVGLFEVGASRGLRDSEARGYFNLHGESPLGGHLRIARCAAIYFMDRPFFGRRSCSLQFINIDGGAMFKVFVGRDEKRELIADQLARFERLRDAETNAA